MITASATSRAWIACLALLATPFAAAAGDVPQAVKVACSGDYQKHCNKHEPKSDAARECMAGVFDQLSDRCVTAILDSDLVGEQAAPVAPDTRLSETAKPARKAAKARHAQRPQKARKRAHKRRTVRTRTAARVKKIGRYIKRGTRIAKSRVSRAFARAFR